MILLSPYEDDNLIFQALKAGVSGYLSKDISAEEVASTIRKVFEGQHISNDLLARPRVARRVLEQIRGKGPTSKFSTGPLSPHESEILDYLASGYSSKDVAHAIATGSGEITDQIACIISKLVSSE